MAIVDDANAIGMVAFQAALTLTFVFLVIRISRFGQREKDLPPGPPTVFGLGNLHMIPSKASYLKLSDWAREYGQIYSLKVGSKTTIVLTGPSAVHALMEKENAVTQGRPMNWLIDNHIYRHDRLAFTDMPSKVSTLRRAFSGMLNPQMSLNYASIQEAESTQLLYNLLSDPSTYFTNVKRYTFSVMLSVGYGIRAPRWETPIARTFYKYTHLLGQLLAAGATPPLDFIPFLRWLPESMASWKGKARMLRSQEESLCSGLNDMVRKRMTREGKNGCFMEQAIENQSSLGLTDHMLLLFGGTTLLAGSDTTGCFLLSAILLLLGEEGVQARAHEELDRVVGTNRVPTLADVQYLPYLRAIEKEVERLRPVIPFGVPHRATADLLYEGYRIPKNATIIVNTWGMGHDPEVFKDPEVLRPERWLDSDFSPANPMKYDKSSVYAFGVGRRMCVGMHIAKQSIHIVLSRLLWAFDIVKAQDPVTGQPIEVDKMDYADGIPLSPKNFPCQFRIRSPAHAEAIKTALREAAPHLELYEKGIAEEDLMYVKRERQNLFI